MIDELIWIIYNEHFYSIEILEISRVIELFVYVVILSY